MAEWKPMGAPLERAMRKILAGDGQPVEWVEISERYPNTLLPQTRDEAEPEEGDTE